MIAMARKQEPRKARRQPETNHAPGRTREKASTLAALSREQEPEAVAEARSVLGLHDSCAARRRRAAAD